MARSKQRTPQASKRERVERHKPMSKINQQHVHALHLASKKAVQ